jgi:triacylglycerol lipase
MSNQTNLLLWSALALVLGVGSYALARGDLGWLARLRIAIPDASRLARLRAAIAESIRLERARAAFATTLRWLARARAVVVDRGFPRVRAALASALNAAVRLRSEAQAQLPSPPPAQPDPLLPAQPDPQLPALAPVKRRPRTPQLQSPPPTQPNRQLPALAPIKRRPRAPGECEHPIVLAHGWMAVDAFSLPGMRQEYFRGVREQLRAHGHRVYVSRVSPFATVPRRAEQLAEQLTKIDADKVNIVAHSMGGLDARYAITRLGLAERVASLTTIGTPHRGTPLADASLVLRDMPRLQRALRSQLGLDFDAVHDLTTVQMAEFNEAVPDMQDVRYTSYIGCVRGGVRDVHTLLAPGFAFLKRKMGANDGIVPAVSQRWGNVVGEVRADHWAQIGWSHGLDVKRFYAAIARALARAGL